MTDSCQRKKTGNLYFCGAAMKETYEKLKTMLQEELPYYSLCYKTYSFITVKEFTSTETPTFFDMYRGCDTWKWKKVVVTEQKDDE